MNVVRCFTSAASGISKPHTPSTLTPPSPIKTTRTEAAAGGAGRIQNATGRSDVNSVMRSQSSVAPCPPRRLLIDVSAAATIGAGGRTVRIAASGDIGLTSLVRFIRLDLTENLDDAFAGTVGLSGSVGLLSDSCRKLLSACRTGALAMAIKTFLSILENIKKEADDMATKLDSWERDAAAARAAANDPDG